MTDKGKVVQTVVTTETTTEYDDSSTNDKLRIIIYDVFFLVSIGLSLLIIFYDKPKLGNLKASSLSENGRAKQYCKNSN